MQSRSLSFEYALAAVFAVAVLASAFLALAPRQAFASANDITATTTISSNNAASSSLATSTSVITFVVGLTTPAGVVPTTTPTVTLLGHAISMATSTSASTFKTYSYSTSTLSYFTAGPVVYTITYLNDSAAATTNTKTEADAPAGVLLDMTAPTNQDAVFAASTTKLGGVAVTIVSSGVSTSTVWFAPAGLTSSVSFSAGATMTTAGGTATSILAPATAGAYKLYVIDGAGNVSTQSTATLTVDGAGPVITVTGSNPLSLYANNATSYSDAGATAVDDVDGSVTVTTTSNNVNQASAGTYTVGYSATDSAGNTTTASRTVTVTAPGGGGPIAGSIGGSGGSLLPVLPGTTPISQTSAPGVNPSGATSTVTVEQLQQQLATLIAQLAALTGGTTFSRDLTVGSTGDDVKALQQYLNRKGYEVAASGAGSAGEETTRFGPATKAALAKFQAGVGISPASGYFGAKTRAYVNANQ